MGRDTTFITDSDDVRKLSLADVPTRPTHDARVLVEPTVFDREYVINPYMAGTVDADRAREQWERLRDRYDRADVDLHVLDPTATDAPLNGTDPAAADRPDMVFVANHAIPSADGEPAHFRAWAEAAGYEIRPAPNADFEGAGDALWHPNRQLLWAGYGVRTERAAYDELAETLDATIVPVALSDEHYYHLDVCFAPLSESEVLIQPEAFTDEGLTKIDALFERVIEAPATEATDGLAVNVEVLDDTVLLGADAPETASRLRDAGYAVETLPTTEFRKAGGSVCCLTLSLGTPA